MNTDNLLHAIQNFIPTKTNLKHERRQVTSVVMGVLSITIITALVQLLCIPIIQLVAPELLEEDWFNIVLSAAPMYLIAFPLSFIFFGFGSANPPKQRKITLTAWFGLLAIGYVLILVGNVIGLSVNSAIESLVNAEQENALSLMIDNVPLWLIALVVAVAAPIVEEIVYRKLVIDRLRRYGDLTAIVVSGVIFGLIHGNFSQCFYATLLGFLFGFVYVYSGKLRYSIALHMAINFIGTVYSYRMTELLEHVDENATELSNEGMIGILMLCGYYVFIFACIIVAPTAITKLRKYVRLKKPTVKMSFLQTVRVWVMNLAVWALLAVIALLFLSSISLGV